MYLRNVQVKDLPFLVAIERENFEPAEQISEEVLAEYVSQESETCLIIGENETVLGFILARPTDVHYVTDSIFYKQESTVRKKDYLAIASLAVTRSAQGQGLGTLLLAALKEVAVVGCFKGISLTCKESLLGYYEMNHFEDLGVSESKFGGAIWMDMYWENKGEAL